MRSIIAYLGYLGCLSAVAFVSVVGCGAENEEQVGVHGALNTAGNCPAFNDDEVCICRDINFQGTCVLLEKNTHFYANPTTLNPVGNDALDSIATGANVKAKLCTDSEYRGTCTTIGPSQKYYLVDFINGFNMHDSVSSMRVDSVFDNCLAPPAGKVSLFEDANYGGDCVLLDAGNYPSPAFTSDANGHGGSFGLRNDSVSSLIVGGGVTLVMYWNINFGPGTIQFNTGAAPPNLGPYNWNDGASSVRVF
jgi:hypothetical protein